MYGYQPKMRCNSCTKQNDCKKYKDGKEACKKYEGKEPMPPKTLTPAFRKPVPMPEVKPAKDNDTVNSPENSIDIKKWKRRLDRSRQHLKELRDNEKNLSEWGKHDLGYFKGYVSALENLFDDLGIEVDE